MRPAVCNICGDTLRTRFGAVLDPQTRETFAIDECLSCGLGHTVIDADDLGRYYGPAYHGGRHGLTAAFCTWRRMRLVTHAAGAGAGRQLLDVGCGDGTFLLAAQKEGWLVVGTELNRRIAQASGLDVRETIEQAQARAPFDCITLWHSLEHMRDPAVLLKALANMLTPEGVLVVAVPDAHGLQARVLGAKWFHLDVPRHLYHFGQRSLARLLEASGFDITQCRYQEFEYDMLGWAQSALNAFMPTPNVFFSALTGRTGASGPAQKMANCVLGVLFLVLALPLTTAGTLLRRGGTLVAVARRKQSIAREYNYV